ncbi:MAG: MFS transporter [bacterium]
MNESKISNAKAVWGWCLYDFANSPFTTVVVTFVFASYFARVVVGDEIQGSVIWSRGITVCAVVIALLSPIMGAIADRGGYRKLFLFAMTLLCVIGSVQLYWIMPGQIIKGLVWFILANIAYEMGCVFYNAFLPDIAGPERIGRISGYGWAMGYVGGLLSLVLALFALVQPETPWFGFSKENYENLRATNLMVALWFAVFCIPTLLWVREDRSRIQAGSGNIIRASFSQLVTTFYKIRRYRQIVRLLTAKMIYNDGLITVFYFSGIYAQGTFGFTNEELIILGIGLNVAAGAGAFLMGFLDDYLGGRKTIAISLIGLSCATLTASAAPGKAWIWVAGILAGIFSGPNQSATRSLMARFVPPSQENEFFGFFAFSGKATSFLGPLLFGWMTLWFQSQRAGVLLITLFFIVGGMILWTVNEEEGIRLARLDENGNGNETHPISG